jgi:hypothetical protein
MGAYQKKRNAKWRLRTISIAASEEGAAHSVGKGGKRRLRFPISS